MLKVYDSVAVAWTEHGGRYYDDVAAAWVDARGIKTYDTEKAAWVEHGYCGWFYTTTKTVQSTDTLEISPDRLYFRSDYQKYPTQYRNVTLTLYYDYKAGDVIELDLATNAGGTLSLYHNCLQGQSTSSTNLYIKPTGEAVDMHVSVTVGKSDSGATMKNIRLSTSYSYSDGAYSAIAEIRNFKINGKRYGFAE